MGETASNEDGNRGGRQTERLPVQVNAQQLCALSLQVSDQAECTCNACSPPALPLARLTCSAQCRRHCSAEQRQAA